MTPLYRRTFFTKEDKFQLHAHWIFYSRYYEPHEFLEGTNENIPLSKPRKVAMRFYKDISIINSEFLGLCQSIGRMCG